MKLGVYIHIPFCKRKCNYCDFLSSSDTTDMDAYLKKLKDEIEYYKSSCSNYEVDTVFVGGGTPSVLRTGALSEILNTLFRRFRISNNPEITVEANPDTLDVDKVTEYSLCATRVSVGVQSLSNKVLKVAGRLHDENGARRALGLLSQTNLDVSADLMLGLPLDDIDGVIYSTKGILDYGIGHLSAYGLKVEENTKFYKVLKENEMIFPDDDLVTDMYDRVVHIAKSYGLERYEVSNFAKLGSECKHNVGYWRRKPYLGLGVGAHSLLSDVRYENTSNIKEYLQSKDFSLVRKVESKLTVEDKLFEEIMLGLRLRDGINLKEINDSYGINFLEKFSEPLRKLDGVLERNNDKICVKEGYFYALNSIIVEFLN